MVFHVGTGNYLGFHGEVVKSSEEGTHELFGRLDDLGEGGVRSWNLTIILNMIPLIGNLVAGFVHIGMGQHQYNNGKEIEEDNKLVLRGIIEFTIVGGVLLSVIDVIATLGRILTTPPEHDQYAS